MFLSAFLNFLKLDNSIFLNTNLNPQFNLNNQNNPYDENLFEKINRDENLITLNKKDINDLGLSFLLKIKASNLFFTNENEIIFNTKLSLYDLMSFYRLILSKELSSSIKLIEKVKSSKNEIFSSENTKQINNELYENLENILSENQNIKDKLNLKSFLTENYNRQSNKKLFYGWNIFDKKTGFDLFIGFNNEKIIGCYINKIKKNNNYNDKNLIYNSCVNVVKKLF